MSLIRKNYTLSSYSNNSWVIEIFGQHFIINEESKILLDILSVSKNYDEAVFKFNKSFDDEIDKDSFLELIKKIFLDIPIFHDNTEDIAPQKNFIKFQKTLISAKLAGTLIYPIKFLFKKKIFWTFFAFLSLLAITIIIKVPLSLLYGEQVLWIAALYTPTIFLHELGHIAACNRYTRKNGDIGVGIYFIFPVFYSGVSAAWHATKEERVIVNLAGVYMQLLCMIVFITIYFMIDSNLFLQMAYILAVYSFVQLIPFVRSDGYWLLSDLSSTPNLQGKSNKKIIQLVKSPQKILKTLTPPKFFVLLYGLFNILILGFFLITQIVFNWKVILNFPFEIITILNKIFNLEFSQIVFSPNMITILIFYIIVFGYVKKIAQQIKNKILHTNDNMNDFKSSNNELF